MASQPTSPTAGSLSEANTGEGPTRRAGWTIPALMYYATPFVFGAFVSSLIVYGSGWFMSWISWSRTYLGGDPSTVSGSAMFAVALICLFVAAMRVYGACTIPLRATLGATADRWLSFVPIIMIGGWVIWAAAKGWGFDPMTIRFIIFSMLSSLVFDVGLSGLIVNVVRDARRLL